MNLADALGNFTLPVGDRRLRLSVDKERRKVKLFGQLPKDWIIDLTELKR